MKSLVGSRCLFFFCIYNRKLILCTEEINDHDFNINIFHNIFNDIRSCLIVKMA